MNQETINAIQQALTPIAEKIGQTTQYGWEIVVRQQYVLGVIGIFWSIIGLILLVVSFLTWKWAIGYWKSYYDDESIMILPFFLALLALVPTMAGALFAITHFLNPEYYALQFFISLGKP